MDWNSEGILKVFIRKKRVKQIVQLQNSFRLYRICGSPECYLECFDPIVARSGRDLIPVMVYGSVVVSPGLLSVFGREVAEIPIVATSREYQGKVYFQALFSCIERLLCSLNVENVVLPAAEDAESIWTKKLGFQKMGED